jgi:outer membrane protein insertion porin family
LRALGGFAVSLLVLLASAMPAAAQVVAVSQDTVVSQDAVVSQQTVVSIEVDGHSRVEESAILLHVSQDVGALLDESTVDGDLKAIYGMRFFDNVWVEREIVADGVKLRYMVREQPYITEVTYENNGHTDIEDLEAVNGVRPRTIFDPLKAFQALNDMRKVYASKGYPDADAEWEVEPLPDNEGRLVYKINEGSLVQIEDIRFEGVEAFSHGKLRRIMATRKAWTLSWLTGAGILNDEEISTDVERLTAFYYDNGYVEARVDEPGIVREGDGLVITMRVDEGKQFHVKTISFLGEVLLPEEELLAASGFEAGQVFKPSKLREAIFGLTEAYGDLGYAFADVRPLTNVDDELAEVAIRFELRPNDIVEVRRIDIRGNTKTRDYVLRREMRLNEGETFSGSGLRRSRSEIRRLGFFDEVEVSSQRTEEPDKVDLTVDVTEGRTGTFAAGAGFSSSDNLLLNGRITERNLFGRGQTLTFNIDFGSRRQSFRIGFVEPYLFNTPLTLGVELFDWSFDFNRFTRGGRGASLRLQYPLWELPLAKRLGFDLDFTRAGLEYSLENSRINGVARLAPPSVQAEEGERRTSSMRATLVRNTIDHPFDPTEGTRHIAALKVAGLGGDTEYTKLELSTRWYLPLYSNEGGNHIIYSFNANLGYGVGDSGLSGEELPLFERYFPGGISTVRGFRVRSLGPQEFARDANEEDAGDFVETGGSNQLIINNEIIFPIAPEAGLKGVVFFDAGNAFTSADGIDVGNLRLAVGAGVRWLSPFGPLRVELGFPLDRMGDESASELLFSFGTPF